MPPQGAFSFPTQLGVCWKVRRVKRNWQLSGGLLASKRNQAIRDSFRMGQTVSEIADLYGISIQRVHQIINNR